MLHRLCWTVCAGPFVLDRLALLGSWLYGQGFVQDVHARLNVRHFGSSETRGEETTKSGLIFVPSYEICIFLFKNVKTKHFAWPWIVPSTQVSLSPKLVSFTS